MDTIVDVTATTTTNGPTERPCDRAYALGRELQSLAAAQASLDHDFCVLVNRFDATGRSRPSTASSLLLTIWLGRAR